MTHSRSYHVEPNEDPLTRGPRPWLVVCPDDGWSLECRTYAKAMDHAVTLSVHDTVLVSISAKAMEARS